MFPRTIIAAARHFIRFLFLLATLFSAFPQNAHAQISLPTDLDALSALSSTVGMVKDLNGIAYTQMTASSAIDSFTTTNHYLFFFDTTATTDQRFLLIDDNAVWHLWRTDGTADGTQRAIDLTGYQRSDLPAQAGADWFYLFVKKGQSLHLFRSDGNSSQHVGAIPDGQSILAQAIGDSNTLYYVTGQTSAPAASITLWRVRPDSSKPAQLWQSGALAGPSASVILHTTSTALYLVAQNTSESSTLYSARYDAATLSMLTTLDAWPSAVSSDANQLYYFVDSDQESQLWRTTGTLTETVSLFTTPPTTATHTNLLTFTTDEGHEQIYFSRNFPKSTTPFFAYGSSEFFYSDGTSEGTRSLTSLIGKQQMDDFLMAEGKVYFWVSSPPEVDSSYRLNAMLYVSDGTSGGTDYANRDISFTPTYTIIGHKHFYVRNQYHGLGVEPSVLDTAQADHPITLLRDINAGAPSSIVSDAKWGVFQGVLYFSATDGFDGNELWRSDGTREGTWEVKDINTKRIPPSDAPHETVEFSPDLTAGQHYLYFVANEGRNGPHVYRTDGTEAGTITLPNATLNDQWTSPRQLTTQGDTLYFLAEYRYTEPTVGTSSGLWRSDGTEAGTRLLVENIWALGATMTIVNNRLLLVAPLLGDGPWGLWRLNDKQDGFEILKSFDQTGQLGDFISTSNQTFFQFPANTDNKVLWRSDGTAAGTSRVDGFNTQQVWGGDNLVYGRYVNYGGDNSVHYWRSDGTTAGTFEVKSFYPSFAGENSPVRNLVNVQDAVLHDRLYIAYTESGKHTTLWSNDGTAESTQPLGELYTVGDYDQAPLSLTTDGDSLYVKEYGQLSQDSPLSLLIWRSDGTPATTRPFIGISGNFSELPTALMVDNGYVFFNISSHGSTYLLLTNGDPLCTRTITSISEGDIGPPSFAPIKHTSVGGKLYFMYMDYAHGDELWAADTSRPLVCSHLYLPNVGHP